MPFSAYGKMLPVDSRIVQRVAGSPGMMSEQSSNFMGEWGGPQLYVTVSQLPINQRMTFFAIKSGLGTSSEVSIATGIDQKAVDASISALEARGLVTSEEVTPSQGV